VPNTDSLTLSPGSYLCSGIPQPHEVCETVSYQVFHPEEAPRPYIPADPSTPEEWLIDNNIGWNAWAWSIEPVGYGYGIRYDCGDVRAAFIGLAVRDVVGSAPRISDIPHGLIKDDNGVHVILDGSIVETLPTATCLRIERMDDGNIRYIAGDYALDVSMLPRTGYVSAVAMLYQAYDAVSSPTIYLADSTAESASATGSFSFTDYSSPTAGTEQFASASGSFSFTDSLFAATSDGTAGKASGRIGFSGYANGSFAATLTADLPLLTFNAYESEGVGMLIADLPALTFTADDNAEYVPPGITTLTASMPPLQFISIGVAGHAGDLTADLPALAFHGGDEFYGRVEAELPALGFTSETAGDTEGFISVLIGYSFFEIVEADTVPAIYEVSFLVNGTLTPAFTGTRNMVAGFLTDLQASTVFGALGAYKSAFITQLNAGTMMYAVKAGQGSVDSEQVWVMNIETGAMVQYEQYGFNSYFDIAGHYYGVADDGVYLLEGDTDNGDLIEAFIELPMSVLGSMKQKSMSSAYAAVASDDVVILKVMVDGTEYTYEARSSSTVLKTHRIDIGRGLKGNEWKFTLMNKEGSDFELQSLEFMPVATGRRI